MNVTLNEAKRHLNIESDFTDDDDYITMLIEASEDKIAKELCISNAKDLAIIGGSDTIPNALKIAVLLNVGNYYANREEATFAQSHPLVEGSQWIVQMYRDYTL